MSEIDPTSLDQYEEEYIDESFQGGDSDLLEPGQFEYVARRHTNDPHDQDFLMKSTEYSELMAQRYQKLQKITRPRTGAGALISTISQMRCSVQCAKELRHQHWGFEIVGISRPCPIEQCRVFDRDYCPPMYYNEMITMVTSYVLQTSTNRLDIERTISTICRLSNNDKDIKTKIQIPSFYEPYTSC